LKNPLTLAYEIKYI